MVMPQDEAYENHNLSMKTGKGASQFCYRGVANLIQLMMGQANELWNVVGLTAVSLEPPPTQPDNHITGTTH
jgi:hypothetical protein